MRAEKIFLIMILFFASLSLSELNVNYQILEKEIYPNSFATLILNFQNPTKNEIKSLSVIFESENKDIEIIPKEFEIESLAANSQIFQNFLIKVGNNARTSNIRAYISYYSDSQKENFVLYIPIKVIRNPILIIKSINFSQDYLEIGKSINVSVEIYNFGYSSAKDVKIKIIPQPSLISSKDEIYVKEIRVGESFVTTFTIHSMPEISPAYYYVQLTLFYSNEENSKLFNETKQFSIKVYSEPKINIYIDEIFGNSATLKIINSGLSKAKNLVIYANEKIYFIDELDVGEDKSIDVSIIDNSIKLKLEYYDVFNNKHVYSENISLETQKPNITLPTENQNNLSKTSSTQTFYVAISIVVIAIIVFVLYSKFFKKKKK